jgi:uncharacterized protein (TIGR03000 family)
MRKRNFLTAPAILLAIAVLLAVPQPAAAQRVLFRGGGFNSPGFFGPSYWPSYGGYYPGNYWYPSPYLYSSPTYNTYYYSQPTVIYVVQAVPQTTTSSSSYQGEPENAARIEITVPTDAELWFDGKKTKQTGPVRHFATPPLFPGQMYSYDVRATWKDEKSGATVTRTRTVDVQAGQKAVMNMMEVDR